MDASRDRSQAVHQAAIEIEQEMQMVKALKRLSIGGSNRDPDLPFEDAFPATPTMDFPYGEEGDVPIDTDSSLWVRASEHPLLNANSYKNNLASNLKEIERRVSNIERKRSMKSQPRLRPGSTSFDTDDDANKRNSTPSLKDLSVELESLSLVRGVGASDAVSLARTLSVSATGYTKLEKRAMGEMSPYGEERQHLQEERERHHDPAERPPRRSGFRVAEKPGRLNNLRQTIQNDPYSLVLVDPRQSRGVDPLRSRQRPHPDDDPRGRHPALYSRAPANPAPAQPRQQQRQPGNYRAGPGQSHPALPGPVPAGRPYRARQPHDHQPHSHNTPITSQPPLQTRPGATASSQPPLQTRLQTSPGRKHNGRQASPGGSPPRRGQPGRTSPERGARGNQMRKPHQTNRDVFRRDLNNDLDLLKSELNDYKNNFETPADPLAGIPTVNHYGLEDSLDEEAPFVSAGDGAAEPARLPRTAAPNRSLSYPEPLSNGRAATAFGQGANGAAPAPGGARTAYSSNTTAPVLREAAGPGSAAREAELHSAKRFPASKSHNDVSLASVPVSFVPAAASPATSPATTPATPATPATTSATPKRLKKKKSFGMLLKSDDKTPKLKTKKSWTWLNNRNSASKEPVPPLPTLLKRAASSSMAMQLAEAPKVLRSTSLDAGPPSPQEETEVKENALSKFFKLKKDKKEETKREEPKREDGVLDKERSPKKKTGLNMFLTKKKSKKQLAPVEEAAAEPSRHSRRSSRKSLRSVTEEALAKESSEQTAVAEETPNDPPAISTQTIQEQLQKQIKRYSRPNQPIEFTDLAFGFPLPPPSQSTLIMLDYRFPVHVERAIYRLSHLKLANPKRSLREQVLLSNFMYAYLNLVNHTLYLQQESPETALGEGDQPLFTSLGEDADQDTLMEEPTEEYLGPEVGE